MNKKTSSEKGRAGEDYTAAYLKSKGYNITARNYRKRCGEIDIVAENDNYIVFVEVKTRKYRSMVSGIEAVDRRKQGRIIATADCYLAQFGMDKQPRYDIAEVTVSSDGNMIIDFVYYEEAFDANGFDTVF